MFGDTCYAATFIIFQLLSWIGCCVAFGGALVSFNTGSVGVTGYWDHVRISGASASWDSVETALGSGADCAGAGKGLVALLALAFISLTFTLVVATTRLLGKHSSLPGSCSSTFVILIVELVLSVISAALYFIAIAEWGGACLTKVNSTNGVSNLQVTGFAYLIVCLFLSVLSLPIGVAVILKARPSLPSAGSSNSSNSMSNDGQYVAAGDGVKSEGYEPLSNDSHQSNYGGTSYQNSEEKHDEVVQTH